MNKLKEFYLKREEKDLDKWHHYFDVYDKHLKRFSTRPINVLEIGVFKGGSLKMWSDYFHKQGMIYGMDITEETRIHDNKENIKIIIGDQSDKEFLNQFLESAPKFDVVIDDGGHTAKQQINAFETIYPQMAQDGIYIIEDTHTSYMKEFQDLGPENTFMDYTKELIDQLHDWWRCSGASASQLIGGFTLGRIEFDVLNKIEISNFCKITQSIHIYDSMIIFEKGTRSHPVRDNII